MAFSTTKSFTALLTFLFVANASYSQNTIPATGSVGIGTLSPDARLDVRGPVFLGSNTSGGGIADHRVKFSDYWTGFPDTTYGSEISNDTSTYKTLMIVGNRSAGGTRRVSVWDLFEVNGNAFISENLGIGTRDPKRALHIATTNNAVPLRLETDGSNSGVELLGGSSKFNFYFGKQYNVDNAFEITPSTQAGGFTYSKPALVVTSVGNIGIGTASPGNNKLLIVGAVGTNDYTLAAQHNMQLRVVNGLGVLGTRALELGLLDNGTSIIQSNECGIGYNSLALNPVSGNVGIGTTNPTEKLSVNGRIRAKEVVVDTGWSDYVFTKSYKLAPLSEVAQHIEKEGHLPGVPSAQEVAEKGVSLGDIQAILLAKIEELTLHQIDLEKRLNEQQAEIIRLKGMVP